ncbi:MAG: tetraacyldisaccharide 4'-kinase [Thermodesulfobacterium sp.]|nr:tetraacyldisaccharide 4'-kinase [Thermodesulfobacterium sp.]
MIEILNYMNPYFYIIQARNFFYKKGIFKSFKIPVPVLSVGNLSLGGSGKTSLVRFLCENLHPYFNVTVLSRGYKRKSKGPVIVMEKGKLKVNWEEAGDEPYFLGKIFEKRNVKINILVDENRKRGSEIALKDVETDLILLDDGFQHLKLKRDLDLILLKKEDLKNRLFPFGRLREPLNFLKRADAIILTYQEYKPFDFSYRDKPVFKLYRKNWKILNKNLEKVDNFEGKDFIAFCGLANNKQFFDTLEKLGIKIKKRLSFPDHYHYKDFKLDPEENYITTLKDGVKLDFQENLYFLDFDIEVKGLIEFILKFLKCDNIDKKLFI